MPKGELVSYVIDSIGQSGISGVLMTRKTKLFYKNSGETCSGVDGLLLLSDIRS